jgi:molybdate transport system ATP-binding protein
MIHIDVVKKLLGADGPIELSVKIDINRNDFYTFFGPSGAGKTTMLRMLAGLTKPDSGEISVDGQIWFSSSKKIHLPVQKRNIGFVFQDYALFPTMSVRKNLVYASRKDNKRIDTLLDMMKLKTLEHTLPSSLSGGQRQRVALARALVQAPKILLLDEPLSALDNEMRRSLQDEIGCIHQQFGLTSIIVTHDISEIFLLSNKVVCFDHGKVKKDGTPEQIFTDKLSTKFRVAGTIIDITNNNIASVITVQIGNIVTKVVIDINESKQYNLGQNVIVAAKAFTPVILPIK